MIIYSEINWSSPGVKQNRIDNNIEGNKPLAFIIEDTVVATMPTDRWFSDLMETIEDFEEDISYVSQDNNLFAIKLIKNNQVIDTLICPEKIRAILLSSPKLVGWTLEKHKYAEMIGVGWKYINDDFVIPGEME
jgi:hypothetical protein